MNPSPSKTTAPKQGEAACRGRPRLTRTIAFILTAALVMSCSGVTALANTVYAAAIERVIYGTNVNINSYVSVTLTIGISCASSQSKWNEGDIHVLNGTYSNSGSITACHNYSDGHIFAEGTSVVIGGVLYQSNRMNNISGTQTMYFYKQVEMPIYIKAFDGSAYNGSITVTDGLFTRTATVVNGWATVWVSADKASATVKSTGTGAYVGESVNTTVSIKPTSDTEAEPVYLQTSVGSARIIAREASTSAGIPGITFSVIGRDNKLITATTDSSGTVTFELPSRTYTITEVSFPKGYKNRNQTFDVTGAAAGASTTKYLTYTYYPDLDVSSLTIFLTDAETGVPIPGARFEAGGTVLITDSSGTAKINPIDNGTYSIVQKTTAQYYSFSETAHSVTINSEDKIVELTNAKKKGELRLKLVGVGGEAIPRGRYLITGNGTNKILESDSSGRIILPDAPYGNYTLMEQDIPSIYQPKSSVVFITLDDYTTGQDFIFYYIKNQDKTPPHISFTLQPEENSVASFNQVLTLTDTGVGIKELKIDGVTVKTEAAPGVLSANYEHLITQNKIFSYTLTDYENNIYTTTQQVTCIFNSAVQLSQPELTSYKNTITYEGQTAYVVNGSSTYTGIKFNITDSDTADTWSYTLELKDDSGEVVSSVTKTISVPGSITDTFLYRRSGTGAQLTDGIYKMVVTANDKHNSATKEVLIISKATPPPRPSISYDASSGLVSIDYPADWLDGYAQKMYTYKSAAQSYTSPFNATDRGTVTAAYTDVAGNKSTATVSIVPGVDSDGDSGDGNGNGNGHGDTTTTLPGVLGSGSNGIEETREGYIFYLNIRQNSHNEETANAMLKLIIP